MIATQQQPSPAEMGLTRHPIASLRELIALAIPLILNSFSGSLLSLTDRFLLSNYSQSAFVACCSAMNLLYMPQLGLVIIASISQAFVGHYKGAGQDKMIGPFIWQMIYFSLGTIALSLPLLYVSKFYLAGIEVEKEAMIYFRVMASTNFLYPLGATLASFFMGRGKNNVVLTANLTIQIINICLDLLLIFGVKGIIPPLGILGAAIATVISQSIYCLILFFLFKQRHNHALFGSNQWYFHPALFWEGLKIGIPRSFGRTLAVGAWTVATYFLMQKGGDYILVHSFGLTIFVILSFINEGMGQALVTLNSHSLARNGSSHFKKKLRSSFYFVGITGIILAIPLLMFPNTMIKIYIKDPLSIQSQMLLQECCFWVWIAIIGSGVNRIGVSMVTASRDTIFYASCLALHWITLCIPIFIGVEKLGMSPSKFFLIEGLNSAIMGVIFILRFFKDKPYIRLSPRLIKIRLYS